MTTQLTHLTRRLEPSQKASLAVHATVGLTACEACGAGNCSFGVETIGIDSCRAPSLESGKGNPFALAWLRQPLLEHEASPALADVGSMADLPAQTPSSIRPRLFFFS